ncbi:MAG: cyclic nucleotide-binding domain-containing protein [Acidobacteriota bacterium]|nr:MAG: cyclic nucleotide-binding domain-containing protein [Acidobacteriota bacterium]
MVAATMTLVERALALRSVDAFRAVTVDQLSHVATVSREQQLAAGSVLFREGDPPGDLFVILDGRVRLEQNGAVVAVAHAGEALGTWSLFDEHRRRATAVADEDAHLLVLDRQEFYDVLSEHIDIVKSLVQDLVERLLSVAGVANDRERSR